MKFKKKKNKFSNCSRKEISEQAQEHEKNRKSKRYT